MGSSPLPTVRQVIDPHTGVPAHKQLASVLRARIESGEWPPGSLLPPQPRIEHEYGVGKATVQKAVEALRSAGLIDLDRGIGLRVREPLERERVKVQRGSTVESRMPTGAERLDLGLAEGVPVLVVSLGGRVRVWPADRVTLTFS